MLKVLCGYVEKVDVVGSRTFRDAAHKSQNGVNTAPLVLMVCLCTFCSHRWTESSTLPDIAADLQSIHRALGIAADQHVDFVLIRDDMVARQVRTGFRWELLHVITSQVLRIGCVWALGLEECHNNAASTKLLFSFRSLKTNFTIFCSMFIWRQGLPAQTFNSVSVLSLTLAPGSRAALPTGAGHLEEHHRAQSRGRDVSPVQTQQEVQTHRPNLFQSETACG